VATNVAEEGLDVPTCEFVVRYSPPGTGVQRMQGRGRARKLGAKYKCLVQVGGS
jgi:ERCC4-related helicase